MTDLLPQTILHNHLFYGDNLEILRKHIPDSSVDLVYLDPPFNSDVNYNVLFGTKSKATENDAQVQAFTDTWHWNQQAETAFDDVMTSGNTDAAELLRAIRGFLKESDMMAYLAMMAVRLLELHRVLKDGGSLYLHCDATACAYLKILLDGVFGPANFRNNIVWKRIDTVKGNHGQGSKFFGPNTDDILFYTKGENYHFEHVFSDYTDKYKKVFKYEELDGRKYRLISMIGPGGAAKGNPYYECLGVSRYWRYSKAKMSELMKEGLVVQLKPGQVPQKKLYLDQGKGVASQSLWDGLKAAAKEKLGYPTQKPVALLERIIATSSKPGDVILDPFCGCGTTIHAAQKLGRTWVGIDVTHLAISLIDKRLNDAFPGIKFSVHGTPRDLSGAKALAAADKYQFQWWAVSLVNAVPWGGKKKGADGGIDGVIYFKPDGKTTEKAIVSVKGGENVNVAMVRDLAHVVVRENAKIGIFITLAPPSKPMLIEAVKEGFYEPPQHAKVPKIQILTIENLLKGSKPSVPMVAPDAFKKASKEVATHPTLF